MLKVKHTNLPRIAWHIGNRHTPCQVERDHLLIQEDHVMEGLLRLLGADIEKLQAPFIPEGGAYGHGRTHSHFHNHSHQPSNHIDTVIIVAHGISVGERMTSVHQDMMTLQTWFSPTHFLLVPSAIHMAWNLQSKIIW